MGQFMRTVPTMTSMEYTVTAAGPPVVPYILPFPALAGRTINLITYNTLVLIPETAGTLDAQGYYYDSATQSLVFGFPLNDGDVLQILFT